MVYELSSVPAGTKAMHTDHARACCSSDQHEYPFWTLASLYGAGCKRDRGDGYSPKLLKR